MPEARVHATVAWSPAPREVQEWPVVVPAGATVREAILASGLAAGASSLALEASSVGIWGRKVPWTHVVREGDRVELYRGLLVDPKVARRERFRKQGARAAGLFANRRPGAKQGY